MTKCEEHDYVHSGVVYEMSDWPMAGTSAHEISYFDAYFCRKCLDRVYHELPTRHNSYQKVRFGARPKPRK